MGQRQGGAEWTGVLLLVSSREPRLGNFAFPVLSY